MHIAFMTGIEHFKKPQNWRYAIRVLKAAEVDLVRVRHALSFPPFKSKLNSHEDA